MTRKKIKLAFITNDAIRKATYKKRKNDLVKKLNELTTLCEVEACVVHYPSHCDSQSEATERFKKLREENHRKELTQVMFQNLGEKGLHNVKEEDLDELGQLIGQNLKDTDKRILALVKAHAYGGKTRGLVLMFACVVVIIGFFITLYVVV